MANDFQLRQEFQGVPEKSNIDRMKRCLIFDADDTLWENNIYFEAAIEEFFALTENLIGEHNKVAPNREAVLELLNTLELESIPKRGYGSIHFVSSLRETFTRIYTGTDGQEYHDEIDAIRERLLHHPIDLIAGVEETVESLRHEYRLILFTKGDYNEQYSKVLKSGLKDHFHGIEIANEKHVDAYHDIVERHSLERDQTFMIGNSPRSDVIPALHAGLWAVFVPHAHTWTLEHEEIPPHPRLLHAESLRDLPSILKTVFPPD
jgi:putative hydrolase of the HAD superfamily